MRLSVLVPSYKRPDLLRNCFHALERQTRMPDEVIIVIRDTDADSQKEFETLASSSALHSRMVLVNPPGQMPAMNRGLDEVSGDIVCITDDDAEPFPDWLEKIEQRFCEDPALGGLGGRDHLFVGGVRVPTITVTEVGRIQWFGRSIGNHHQESNGYREVDCLKGCNMSFRTEFIPRFEERLRGDAYQNEVAICLAVSSRGMKLKYDPEICVNHFLGGRDQGLQRTGLSPERLQNNSHNHVLVRMPYFSAWRRWAYLAYSFMIGDDATPGVLKAAQISRFRPGLFFTITSASLKGKWQGIMTWRSS